MICRNALILLSFFVITLSASAGAQAKPKNDFLFFQAWPPGHEEWTSYTKFQPYLENTKHPHNTQWAGYGWYAEDWITQSRSGLSLVNGFYQADILKDQETEEGVPVLVVGPSFYRLSGLDKRRVVTTVDTVYGVTKSHPNGTILLKDWHTKLGIGIYTEHGLQLQ